MEEWNVGQPLVGLGHDLAADGDYSLALVMIPTTRGEAGIWAPEDSQLWVFLGFGRALLAMS